MAGFIREGTTGGESVWYAVQRGRWLSVLSWGTHCVSFLGVPMPGPESYSMWGMNVTVPWGRHFPETAPGSFSLGREVVCIAEAHPMFLRRSGLADDVFVW